MTQFADKLALIAACFVLAGCDDNYGLSPASVAVGRSELICVDQKSQLYVGRDPETERFTYWGWKWGSGFLSPASAKAMCPGLIP